MDRPSFSQLLSRADDETLQHLVGPHAVRLLSALDPHLATPARLRQTCLQLHPPEDLLVNQESRARLLTLLRPEHATALAEDLGLDAHAPYAQLQEIGIRRNSTRQQRLFAFFGMAPPETDVILMPGSLDTVSADYALFDHQRTAEREVLDALRSPERRVLLHMPTGAGKTRTALHVVASELRRREPTVILWLGVCAAEKSVRQL